MRRRRRFINVLQYLLRDEFTTARAAGSINGTAAEPGPGARTVVDATPDLYISAGRLRHNNAGATTFYYLPNTAPKQQGRIYLARFYYSFGEQLSRFGLSDENAGTPTSYLGQCLHGAVGELTVRGTPASAVTVGTLIGNALNTLGFIEGAVNNKFYFLNGKLLYIIPGTGATNRYPFIMMFQNTPNASYFEWIRIPQALWLPTPLLSTSGAMTWPTTNGLGHAEGVAGGLGAGGGGLTLLDAGTWSVAGGYVLNTPVAGAELVVDGTFDTDIGAGNWTGVNWTIGVTGLATHTPGSSSELENASAADVVAGQLYKCQADFIVTASYAYIRIGGAVGAVIASSGTKMQIIKANTTGKPRIAPGTSIFEGTVDNFSAKLLPISTLITNQQLITSDVLAELVIHAYTSGTQVGIVQSDRPFAFLANADAAAGQPVIVLKGLTNAVPDTDTLTIVHPIAGRTTYAIASVSALAGGVQTITLDDNLVEAVSANDMVGVNWASWNGVLRYFDAGNIKIDEIKAGVYTNRASNATAFSADARFIMRKIGTEYRGFYNEVYQVAITTVDAASMVGKYWGIYSTDVSNTFNSFLVHDTGNLTNAYAILDKWSRD